MEKFPGRLSDPFQNKALSVPVSFACLSATDRPQTAEPISFRCTFTTFSDFSILRVALIKGFN